MSTNKKNRRILFVAHSKGLGGAERSLMEIVMAFSSTTSYHLGIVFPVDDVDYENFIKGTADIEDVDVYSANYPWWIYGSITDQFCIGKHERYTLKLVFRSLKPALSIIEDFKPDVIITNTSTIPTFAIAARLKHIPHCWFIRELITKTIGSRFILGDFLSYHIISRLSNIVYVNSKYVKSEIEKFIPSKKIEVIYQAVEGVEAISSKPRNEKIICLVAGAIRPLKGQKEIIDAFRHLDATKFELRVAGNSTSDYALQLRECAPENVIFLGEVSDLKALYQNVDVVIIGSLEAYGRTAIEAMVRGLPVVYTNKGAGPELVADGWNGYLYEPGNAESLASKLKLLIDKDVRTKLGMNGHSFASTYCSQSKMMTDIICPMEKLFSDK